MWWRFLTFCVLVCCILFVVLSCIHGRPVTQLLFHRCCEDNIENDQAIFENFGDNFLRERLVGADEIVVDNHSFVSSEEVEEVISVMRDKMNVHDPKSRVNVTFIEISPEEETSEEMTTEIEETFDIKLKVRELPKETEESITLGELNNTNTKVKTLLKILQTGHTKDFPVKEEVTPKIEKLDHQKKKINLFLNGTEKEMTSDEELNKTNEFSEKTDVIQNVLVPKSEMVSINKEVLSELDSEETVEMTTRSTEDKLTTLFSIIK